MKNIFQGIRLLVLLSSCGVLLLAFFLYTGVILFNHPSKDAYPVRGVDVSHYQGNIDWKVLSEQDIQFAYIKATEGDNFIDKNFLRICPGCQS